MPSEHSSDVKFENGHVLFIDIVGYSKLLMNDLVKITTFAKRYAKAWCSQNPKSVAAFFASEAQLALTTDRPRLDARRLPGKRKRS
jgi:hypothetical protein